MIEQIADGARKSRVAEEILADLPEWFGIPESTRAYVEGCAGKPFWAEVIDGAPAGFIALRETGPKTAEIYVMGVKKAMQRRGVGRRLFAALYAHCQEHGYAFLQVKTVDAGRYPEYDRTRLFYESMGFTRFEVFPTLWDERNPCLVLVMAVSSRN